MKKIDKYIRSAETPTLMEELKNYRKLTLTYRNQAVQKTAKKISPLSLIIPFAAASLSTIGVNAQCGNAIITTGPGIGDGQHLLIDVDGDGTVDFELDADAGGNPDLFLRPKNGAEFIGTNVGGFIEVDRFAFNDAISSAANWVSPVYGTMDYQNNGAWHAASGTQTGYVAIRLPGNKLGFMEVSWNNDTEMASVNVSQTGVQDATQAGNTSVNAGNCAVLPVELMIFKGELNDSQVDLAWSTASETNNRGFDIERSLDGVDYEKIGFVEGQGNSTQQMDYDFVDDNIKNNRQYYYRLKQIDFWDGSTYSEIVTVKSEQTIDFRFGPNPTNGDNIMISFTSESNDDWEISVFDSQGRLVIQPIAMEGRGNDNLELDIRNLTSGNYFIRLTSGVNTEYKKFIKLD